MINDKPSPKCRNCGKYKYMHRFETHACPAGLKTKIGYTRFHSTNVYQPKTSRSDKKV